MKLLMWLGFFVLVIAALYTKLSSARITILHPNTNKQFDDTGAEIMVCCAHCGIYTPASEAVHSQDAVFCCEEHVGRPAKTI
jgi:uncharacterized protein